ncbi:MAG: hypothetical protein CO094_00505 [Anaerolineae bacterium CG_4_9_14_3_um_filter_57_17]|nr:hypothetical protein [bacterium]NCT20808.1 hypothetical protein [bacterium]OIO84157.1 MAG: hypothetical protein AUK01_10350 [Anaerolineae bacterium CG2_30_57_67]PJB68665.1 MAG: hypothetical protein CO094_00505 [Anaerolineae bacterium CG_4_9_14_3_um_filter_57_17]
MTDTKSLADNAAQAYQTGDFERAATLYTQAAAGVQGVEAAELKNNASVSWLQAGNAQAAYDAVQDTAEVFAAAADIRRQALALGNEAAALDALTRHHEATAHYQSCADLLESIGEDQLHASVMQSLAGLLMRRGKLFDALIAMNSGLRGVKSPTLKQKILRTLLKIRW